MKCEGCKKYWPDELYTAGDGRRLCYTCSLDELVKLEKEDEQRRLDKAYALGYLEGRGLELINEFM